MCVSKWLTHLWPAHLANNFNGISTNLCVFTYYFRAWLSAAYRSKFETVTAQQHLSVFVFASSVSAFLLWSPLHNRVFFRFVYSYLHMYDICMHYNSRWATNHWMPINVSSGHMHEWEQSVTNAENCRATSASHSWGSASVTIWMPLKMDRSIANMIIWGTC